MIWGYHDFWKHPYFVKHIHPVQSDPTSVYLEVFCLNSLDIQAILQSYLVRIGVKASQIDYPNMHKHTHRIHVWHVYQLTYRKKSTIHVGKYTIVPWIRNGISTSSNVWVRSSFSFATWCHCCFVEVPLFLPSAK